MLSKASVPCPRCHAINDTMQRWQFEFDNSLRVKLGTFDGFESCVDCATCQAIASYFRTETGLDEEHNNPSAWHLQFGRFLANQRFEIKLVRLKQAISYRLRLLTLIDIWGRGRRRLLR